MEEEGGAALPHCRLLSAARHSDDLDVKVYVVVHARSPPFHVPVKCCSAAPCTQRPSTCCTDRFTDSSRLMAPPPSMQKLDLVLEDGMEGQARWGRDGGWGADLPAAFTGAAVWA